MPMSVERPTRGKRIVPLQLSKIYPEKAPARTQLNNSEDLKQRLSTLQNRVNDWKAVHKQETEMNMNLWEYQMHEF